MNKLTPNERTAFRSLRNEPNPPPELEERVVASLRRRGAFARAEKGGWLSIPALRFGMVAAALALAFAAGMVVQAQRPGKTPATPVVLQGPAGVRPDVPPGQYEPFSTREEVAQFVVDGGAHHYCEAHSTAGDHYCTLQKIGDLGSPPVASQAP